MKLGEEAFTIKTLNRINSQIDMNFLLLISGYCYILSIKWTARENERILFNKN